MTAIKVYRRFRDLVDVAFGSLADGDVPTYDSGSGKFVNQQGGSGGPPSGSAGGDLAGTYPNPTLHTAGPGATGPIGDSTHVPVVTIDAKGRVTGLTSTAISVTAGTDSAAVHFLDYDTTGVVDAGPVLQDAYDAGNYLICIPPGLFYCNTPVFFDAEDGMATTRLLCDGVTFLPGSGLPTVAEFQTFCTNRSLLTGTKFLFFPSTERTALSGGVVTTVGHSVSGTATHGATKSGIHPHLIIDGGTLNALAVTNYNAALVHTNTGGAVELRSVHMDSARSLLVTGSNYIDGNKMYNCSGWSSAGTSSYDASMFYQYGSGDGVEIRGVKTAGYIWIAKMYSCNSAHISSSIGGAFKFTQCHGIVIDANHSETANNIVSAPRLIYEIDSSHVTINGSFDYLSNTATDGAIYINDNGAEGQHSTVALNNYFGRQFMDPSTSDPASGSAIYINKMNDRSIIVVNNSWCQTSASNTSFGQSYGVSGLPIGGNAANESTLAAAVAKATDVIGSGTFKIFKFNASSLSTGQNQAMTIGIAPTGALGLIYTSHAHVTPTFFNREHYGVGTLTNGSTYAYAAALCNTLPDGTIQYGKATAEWTITADSAGANVTELYLPTAAACGATLVVWRCDTTGVLAGSGANFRYVIIPVGGSGATRIFDTGTNISKQPWITTSVPVPNSAAGSNHTADGLYINGTAVTIP